MFKIKVGELLSKGQGAHQKHQISGSMHPEENEFSPKSDFFAKIQLLRIGNGIHALLQDGEITIDSTCNRCNEPFEYKVCVAAAERVFYMKRPDSFIEGEEFDFINMKDHEIDLLPMIREEILLHLPLFPVCSKKCKGLCQKCGTNLNKEKCGCPEKKDIEGKPLSILKNMSNQ